MPPVKAGTNPGCMDPGEELRADHAVYPEYPSQQEPCQEGQLAPDNSPEEAIAEQLYVKNAEDPIPADPQELPLPPPDIWGTWGRGKDEPCQEAQFTPGSPPEDTIAEPLENVKGPLEEPTADVVGGPVLAESEESHFPPQGAWDQY
ncbi:uncharacterized protein CIMG_05130 [Coccidioides immitis RS]|uniref:Uncharacterized protein n=1 Tax=Coccidioides immitis (strain RS) TaxID=246410 RepID=J3KEY1_COCIM|nr:uncharacterized protein CIMG_05130 [Coccidioides immitis RS]EAS34106.3 hypothetical protein CIMG_05130 [Coccidioides immitis RS]TPX21692.1 hypothetical protein DIZ76_015654 [Coccidioides immitis]